MKALQRNLFDGLTVPERILKRLNKKINEKQSKVVEMISIKDYLINKND